MASPALLDAEVHTPEQLRAVNALCRYVDDAQELSLSQLDTERARLRPGGAGRGSAPTPTALRSAGTRPNGRPCAVPVSADHLRLAYCRV